MSTRRRNRPKVSALWYRAAAHPLCNAQETPLTTFRNLGSRTRAPAAATAPTILPEPFTSAPMRALPILLVFGAMFYWLWRIRGRRTLPVIVRHDFLPLAARAK